MLGLQEFFRSTQHGGLIAVRPAHVFNVTPDGRVGNVCAVPRQEVVDPVHRSNRNMQRVDHGSGRQRPRGDEGLCKSSGLLAEGEQWNALQGGETSRCLLWVACLSFLHDRRGTNRSKRVCCVSHHCWVIC